MNENEIVKGIAEGKIKWHEVEKHVGGDNFKATEIRRKAVEKITGKKLRHISHHSLDMKRAMKANIENSIGVVQIPMGIAGPIDVKGNFARGKFLVPMATTEGALIASVSRGISVINKSGGATVTILKKATTRGPAVKAPTAKQAREVADWVVSNKAKVKEIIEKEERFLKFIDVVPYQVGRNLYLRFAYDTSDAMGMNMVTIASDAFMAWLEKKFKWLEHVAVSGNMCIDKKPSALTLTEGRGFSIIAEVIIPKEVVKQRLKTSSERISDLNYRKNLLGSALAGAYGFNAHFANVVGALFLACGQDEAHIVEGSHGFTTAEMNKDGSLHVAVTIPSLMVGTVGGGTGVDTQREALEIMGVAGGGKKPGDNSRKLAEIVAATVLAGEISLLGALGARHLTQAHVRLNR